MNRPDSVLAIDGARFEVFHELMTKKIRKILLVISPYDAFLLEQGGSLASRIVSEYRGLNLSHPPRLIRVSTALDAIHLLQEKNFDLVITMPQHQDMDCFALGREIKKIQPGLPVILLAHSMRDVCPAPLMPEFHGVDRLFIWSADPDFLMALVKNVEDHLNVDHDTKKAMVRVMIFVEDSPLYRSALLPLLYKEVVRQTQAVLDESLNLEHRMLTMRARPKILVAENFEAAMQLFHTFQSYVFCVISDTRFPRQGKIDNQAGRSFLSHVRKECPDLPLLLLSSESTNRQTAESIPAAFLDKNSADLQEGIREFFLIHLGFGDFIFRLPDGSQVDSAPNLAAFEHKLAEIPDESLLYHAGRNHFANWVMARSEINLAYWLRNEQITETSPDLLRARLIATVRKARRLRQQGIVSQFRAETFEAEIMDFVKIGQGSMGGKATGLAFMAAQLQQATALPRDFPDLPILIPKTLVITTDGFASFITRNRLEGLLHTDEDDATIVKKCLAAEIPSWLTRELAIFLSQTKVPLIVRSSSILEDARHRPYAGLYKTCLIPNNNPDFAQRLAHLLAALKVVYASTFFAGPKAFSKASGQSHEAGMAVIIQHLVGREYGDYYYPAISGIAQSHNYYPISPMKAEDGIAHIALGLGKAVAEGERALRFSPRHPNVLPQFSTVDDILANAQRYFYALRVRNYPPPLFLPVDTNLERLEISSAADDYSVRMLTSTYFPEEHRIRDIQAAGPKVLTFAQVLKHNIPPLAPVLSELLLRGGKGMGCGVEIEFAANLPEPGRQAELHFLQIRPLAAVRSNGLVEISAEDRKRAFCFSSRVLGHGRIETINDIVYVKSGEFSAGTAKQAAREIGMLNAGLLKEKRPYLLIGPGRWGSADPWLGIPVQWQDISGVGAMIELTGGRLKAAASEGTHFFQNITAMGILYFTINEAAGSGIAEADFLDFKWLNSLPVVKEMKRLRHIRLASPMHIKADGKKSRGVMIAL